MTNISPYFMIFIFMFFMLIFITMIQNNNPIFLIIILVLFTLEISMFMSMMNSNYIFSIIIYLMMISGLLIIFLYFTSLISNEQYNWKNNYFMVFTFIMNMMMMMYIMYNFKKIFMLPLNLMNNSSLDLIQTNNTNDTQIIAYIYSYPFNTITILCILFLLLTLFIIIKICLFKTKSLRKIKK